MGAKELMYNNIFRLLLMQINSCLVTAYYSHVLSQYYLLKLAIIIILLIPTAMVTVGLQFGAYDAAENSSLEVCASIVDRTTSEDISFTISTADGSALGESAF